MGSARIQFLSPATGYIELTQDIVVPLSFGVADIRDIGKRSGAFSKSVVVPGTKQNKETLSHLYDLNIVTGVFNVNKLQKAIIIDEFGSILFNNGIVQLIDVNKVNNTFTNEEEISFTLLIKDTTGDFITSMSDKKLSDLDFSEFTHLFNQSSVTSSWTHTYTDGYKYLMPYIDPIGQTTDNIFHLTEFRPAIYARQYWDKIFASNGYSYTWVAQDSTDIQFSKLVIPYNGDVPKLSQTDIDYKEIIASASTSFQGVEYTATGPLLNVVAPITGLLWVTDDFIADVELKDNVGDYNPTTGLFTPSYDAVTPGGISFIYEINYDIVIVNPPSVGPIRNASSNAGDPLILVPLNIIRNTTTGNYFSTPIGYHSIADLTTFPTGPTTVVSGAIGTCVNTVPNINAFNVLNTQIGLRTQDTQGTWVDVGFNNVNGVKYRVIVNSITVTIKPSTNTLAGFGSMYNLNQFIPDKIKQSDFIKSICTMFNLYIIPDEDNPTNLIIQTRNEYYDQGIVYDATHLLNKNIEQTIEFLPDVTAKRLKLSYKQDTDVANVGYFNNTDEIYGQVEYTFDSEYVKNNETKEIIFSPTPNLDNNLIGANLPYLSGSAPKSNIRILYDGGMLPCIGFQINEVGLIYSSTFTDYPFMGHFDKPINPTYDLNFNQCDYYFYDNFNVITSNNLYNKFWKRTLDTINEGRLVTAYFDVDTGNFANFKLNTKIFLKQYNHYFIINKIIDWNVNSKKPTKVELITYGENIRRRNRDIKVPIKNPIKVPNTSPILSPIKIKSKDRFINLNNDLTGNADIKGFNNFVTILGTNTKIVGSNNYINAPNATIFNDNQIVEFPNTSSNAPATPTTSDLKTILGNGNTTGPQDIIVDVDQNIRTSDIGFIKFGDSGAGDLNSIIISNGGDGVTIPQSALGVSGIDPYFITVTNDIGGLQESIVLDPLQINQGTGIYSKDTVTSDGTSFMIKPWYTDLGTSSTNLITSNSQTDTLFIDPQNSANGTGFQSFDNVTFGQGQFYVRPTSVSITCDDTVNSKSISVQPTAIYITNLDAYADDTAAATAGLVGGALYQTDGTGASPLNVAGIVMIKQ
jgi:hypothetical protein